MNEGSITHQEGKDVHFLVVGAAHLDILATATGDHSTLDTIGNIEIEVGGTACNIALNLKQLGAKVSLLTAGNNSTYSSLVFNLLQKQGLDLLIEKNDQLPMSAFSAHIDANGEMVGAVSCAAVERHVFSDEILDEALDKATCVILDCNLSEKELHRIATRCCERLTPIYVAGVSEEKVVRSVAVGPFVDAVFMKRREAGYLSRKVFKVDSDIDIIGLSVQMGTTLVVTDGARGAVVARSTDRRLSVIDPPRIGHAKNYLGMGDAFVAGTIFAMASFEMRLEEAAYSMLPFVAGLSDQPGCNTVQTGLLDKMMSELKKNAQTCPTTHILNRAAAEDELQKLIYRVQHECGTGSIALIDVDFFKTINDTLGHNVGDLVLIAVADAIRSVLRGHDQVGRWGGDEFLVLIQGDESASLKVAERINSAVAKHCADITPVTLSIGVAEWTNAMGDSKGFIGAADQALYAVKKNGRNGVQAFAGTLSVVES